MVKLGGAMGICRGYGVQRVVVYDYIGPGNFYDTTFWRLFVVIPSHSSCFILHSISERDGDK